MGKLNKEYRSLADLVSIADTLQRFGPELSLPHMSVTEIIGVACLVPAPVKTFV